MLRSCEAVLSKIEDVIAKIWSELLGSEPTLDDDFFMLGGHSLLATQFVARLSYILGIAVPLEAFFYQPTIRGLLEAIQEIQETRAAPYQGPQRTEHGTLVPLSFSQERIWFIEQLQPHTPAYTLSWSLRLCGILDVERLQLAFTQLVERHEVLRTTLVEINGQPMQQIAATVACDLHIVELPHTTADERQAKLEALITAEGLHIFALDQPPLWRLLLIRCEAEEHVLVITMHHSITDAWSLRVIARELRELYQLPRPDTLPPLSLQYADYTLWLRGYLQNERKESLRDYWREQLAGLLPTIELPHDQHRPAIQTAHGYTCRSTLEAALVEDVLALAREEATTPFVVLLSAFYILLYLYSDNEDLLVGVPVANRTWTEIESLIGFFINTLPVRIHLSDNLSVRSLLQQVHEIWIGAMIHQDLPFEDMVAALEFDRDLSRPPLVSVLFHVHEDGPFSLALPTMRIEELPPPTQTPSRYDLEVLVLRNGDCYTLDWTFNADILKSRLTTQLAATYTSLLQKFTANADLLLKSLTPLYPSLLAAPIPSDEHEESLIERLFDWAENQPEQIALLDGSQAFNYRQLQSCVTRFAGRLATEACERSAPIVLLIPTSNTAIALILACLKLGTPFLCLDPMAPTAYLLQQIQDAEPQLLISDEQLRVDLTKHLDRWQEKGHGKRLTVQMLNEEPQGNIVAQDMLPHHGEQIAYITYTAGTTGRPKGIAMTGQALSQLSRWWSRTAQIQAGERVAQWSPLSYDAAYIEICGTLYAGATICCPGEVDRRDSIAILDWIKQTQIKVMQTVPSFLQQLLNDDGPGVLQQVRLLLLAGEVLPPALVKRCQDKYKQMQIFNLYGPSEAILASVMPLASIEPDLATIPIGLPIEGRTIVLCNEAGRVVPCGATGEICIVSPFLAQGYWRQEATSASVFVEHPQYGRMYRTGDLACIRADGLLEFLGRQDTQVKIRGRRVELAEIEAICHLHVAIRKAAVLYLPDGRGKSQLVLFLLRHPQQPEAEEIHQFLEAHLPDYMLPTSLIWLDQWPLLATGKTDRVALAQIDWQAVPTSRWVQSPHASEVPQSVLEERIRQIWQEILLIPNIGRHDDFFTLGGQSLLAMKVIARLSREVRIKLPLRLIFTERTIARLAAAIDTWQSAQGLQEQAET